MLKKIGLTAVLVLFVMGILKAQSLDDIIAENAKAYGGTDKIETIKTVIMAGKIGIMGNLYDLNISSIRPNKARLEVNINGKTLVQAVDGDNGWTINPFMGSSKQKI